MNAFLHRGFRVTRYTLYKKTSFTPFDLLWSFIGSFIGIASVSLINQFAFTGTDLVLLIGSFGASAVLIYGVPESPLAQPRNVIGGHIVSAFIGVCMYQLFGSFPWLASSLAVSCSIIMMQITRTIHPPGGATALIATIGSEEIKIMGFKYVLFPVATGITLLVVIAIASNYFSGYRQYPVKNFQN